MPIMKAKLSSSFPSWNLGGNVVVSLTGNLESLTYDNIENVHRKVIIVKPVTNA